MRHTSCHRGQACRIVTALITAASLACGSEKREAASAQGPAAATARRADTSDEDAACGPLHETDLNIPGIASYSDSVRISESWGEPEGIEVFGDPWDSAGVRVWKYPGVGVEVWSFGAVTITSPSFATARGVRVGDPAQRVVAAYGGELPASAADTFALRYFTDDGPDPTTGCTDGVEFRIWDGQVIAIRAGEIEHVREGSVRPPWEWNRPDWAISSEGLGPIRRQTSERDLIELLGRENVARDMVYLSEDQSELGTDLFEGRLVNILWSRHDPWRSIREILIGVSRWQTTEGIGVATTSLRALEALNGRPFTLSGFRWPEAAELPAGGEICSWQGGRLAGSLRGVSISLGDFDWTNLSDADQGALEGEECRSSSLPIMQRVNPRVSEIRVVFER